MHRLVFNQPLKIDTERGYVASVAPGISYALTDHHALWCVPGELCSELAEFDDHQKYCGGPLDGRSLLVLWLAGLGDTVCFAPALMALQESNRASRIDVVTVPALFEVLSAAGFEGRLVTYPPTVEQIRDYDLFLAMEKFASDPDYHRLSSIDFFGRKLHRPEELSPAHFETGRDVEQRMTLPSTSLRRVGVQVQSLSPVRSYPTDLIAELLKGLIREEYQVHLLGGAGDCEIPSAPPRLYNHCGRTSSFQETVALIRQMDAVVAPDSFLMHLAGTLGVPTVGLFSTIPARLRVGHYQSVVALEPDTPCSPCMVVLDDCCPEGHSECVAFRSPSVSPPRILQAVAALLERRVPVGQLT